MCFSVLLWFIFWHHLNSVTGWFFDYMEFNMDIAMLQFFTAALIFHHWRHQVSIFLKLVLLNWIYLPIFFGDIYWCWQFFFSPFSLLCLSYAPQALCASICLEFAPLSQNIMAVWLVLEHNLFQVGHLNCSKDQNERWYEGQSVSQREGIK